MARKTVAFDPQGIAKLPNDKPVVYKILGGDGSNDYTGIAKRGRVRERLTEHLPASRHPIPGEKVVILQKGSIEEARDRAENHQSKPSETQ